LQFLPHRVKSAVKPQTWQRHIQIFFLIGKTITFSPLTFRGRIILGLDFFAIGVVPMNDRRNEFADCLLSLIHAVKVSNVIAIAQKTKLQSSGFVDLEWRMFNLGHDRDGGPNVAAAIHTAGILQFGQSLRPYARPIHVAGQRFLRRRHATDAPRTRKTGL
jgi:hypothetical protein